AKLAEAQRRFEACDARGPAGAPAMQTLRDPTVSEPRLCSLDDKPLAGPPAQNASVIVRGPGRFRSPHVECPPDECRGPTPAQLREEIVEHVRGRGIAVALARHHCGTLDGAEDLIELAVDDWAKVDVVLSAAVEALGRADLGPRVVVRVVVEPTCVP